MRRTLSRRRVRTKGIIDVIVDQPLILFFLPLSVLWGVGLGYLAEAAYSQEVGVWPLLWLFVGTFVTGALSGFAWMRQSLDTSPGTLGYCMICHAITWLLASTQEAGIVIALVFSCAFALAAAARFTYQVR